DHHLDQFPESDVGLPSEVSLGEGAVPDQQIDLCGPHELRILYDVITPVQIDEGEGHLDEFLNAVRLPGRNHIVTRLLLLQHQPHCTDKVAGVTPVTLRVEITQTKLCGEPHPDPRYGIGDLTGDELEPPPRRFMIEE